LIVLHSSSRDVHENLAAEDLLLDDESQAGPVVLIYRNDDAVVIGKNQNPWRECAVGQLDSMGVRLGRRVSGGGTVYHDDGNYNISCIVPRAEYRREEMLQLFIAGLKRTGVEARIAATTSLAVDGSKISGNAFCYRRDKVLHHGTLLWKSNLDKLRAALTPEIPDMETRAVASCPMPVVNLSQLIAKKEPEDVLNAVIEALSTRWGPVRDARESLFSTAALKQKTDEMKSWDWRFGATPDFELMREGRKIRVHRGVVEETGGKFGQR